MTEANSNRLVEENDELRQRLQELEDTLRSIRSGDVDAIIVNQDIYTLESAHTASNRLRQDVLSQMEDAVFAYDLEDNIIYMNAAAEFRYGVSSSAALGRPQSAIFSETLKPGVAEASASRIEMPWGERRTGLVSVHRLLDGTRLHVESIVSTLRDASGQASGTLAVVRDVTRRWHSDQRRDALVALSDRFRTVETSTQAEFVAAELIGVTLEVGRVGYGSFNLQGETLHVARDWTAPGVQSLAGSLQLRSYGSLVESLKRDEFISIPDVREDPRTADAAADLEARGARSFVNVPVVEQGRLVAVLYINDANAHDWPGEDLAFIREVAERTRSVTERVKSAAALRESEVRLRQVNETLEATVQTRTRELMIAEQALRQAQKMEAVGQLTGGIAHDFNNLLAVISTSLQVLQARVRQGKLEGNEKYIATGLESIRRAASLTQRLLAFARQQTLDPKPTDVNRLIGGMEDLVRRTVGPDVTVEVIGAGGLWPTRIDPSQLENSLLNLCINARDAMLPSGGRLTIETANKWLDSKAAFERDLPAGQYISLCVTDTGAGMSAEVIKRVFDPFFTTKPIGQGTGLGLSMVYGFVRQSGGQIRVYSELGCGTTMCLYLPRFLGSAAQDEAVEAASPIEEGDGQIVLIIDDEPAIRQLIAEVMEEAGYQVLTARDGPSALVHLQSAVRIDVLVTDVGLPGGMNGRQIADAARLSRPALKVLFVTGFAENAALGDGHLDRGMAVLTKPFEIAELARKVRQLAAG